MSVVDAPPGFAPVGLAQGEFGAQKRPKELARFVFAFSLVLGGLVILLASRRIFHPMIEILMVGPLACAAVATVGHAVRSARVRVTSGGVRWGWSLFGFTMGRDRLKAALVYPDAVALVPRRGSIWYLAKRDWQPFEELPSALRRAGIEVEKRSGKAPFRARMQSYGMVLNLLLIGDLLALVVLLGLALV